MKFSDRQRLDKMLDYAEKLLLCIKEEGIEKDDILHKQRMQWMVTPPLYNIGEHAYNISNEFKDKYNNVPWNMVAGLRHRLVHDYDGTNWNIIVEVIYDDLPVLIEQLREIIRQEDENTTPS